MHLCVPRLACARAKNKVLDEVIAALRPKDVLVIWKLDRLGRSLKHLIEVVNRLSEAKIGLKSLNDPIDTTIAQGHTLHPWPSSSAS